MKETREKRKRQPAGARLQGLRVRTAPGLCGGPSFGRKMSLTEPLLAGFPQLGGDWEILPTWDPGQPQILSSSWGFYFLSLFWSQLTFYKLENIPYCLAWGLERNCHCLFKRIQFSQSPRALGKKNRFEAGFHRSGSPGQMRTLARFSFSRPETRARLYGISL